MTASSVLSTKLHHSILVDKVKLVLVCVNQMLYFNILVF
jgi:hypothetical protein